MTHLVLVVLFGMTASAADAVDAPEVLSVRGDEDGVPIFPSVDDIEFCENATVPDCETHIAFADLDGAGKDELILAFVCNNHIAGYIYKHTDCGYRKVRQLADGEEADFVFTLSTGSPSCAPFGCRFHIDCMMNVDPRLTNQSPLIVYSSLGSTDDRSSATIDVSLLHIDGQSVTEIARDRAVLDDAAGVFEWTYFSRGHFEHCPGYRVDPDGWLLQ